MRQAISTHSEPIVNIPKGRSSQLRSSRDDWLSYTEGKTREADLFRTGPLGSLLRFQPCFSCLCPHSPGERVVLLI